MSRLCLELGCGATASPQSRSGSRCMPHDRARNRATRAAYADPAYKAIPLVGRCVDCGTTEDLTRDHVVPVSEGGTNDPSNIVIRCRRHNSAKGAR